MKYCSYIRTSTLKQKKSIVIQVEKIGAYVKSRGGEIVAEYIDEGVSGSKNHKHNLRLAREHCQREGLVLVATKLCRLGRNAEEIMNLYNSSIELEFTDQKLDKVHLQILAVFYENERDTIRERVLVGLEAARRRGSVFGNPDLCRVRGRAVAATVENADRFALRTYDAIRGYQKRGVHKLQLLATLLNGDKYRTQRDKVFTPTTVRRIIIRAERLLTT